MTAATPELRLAELQHVADDAECGQQMRRVGRSATGHEIDRVEVAEQKDRREQGQDQVEIGKQRKVTWVNLFSPVAPSTLAAS